MPRFNQMPPTNGWPPKIARLAAEQAKLQERAAQANRDLVELTGDGTNAAREGILLRLEKEDQAALTEAARNGEVLTDRRPATEKYAIDVEAARTEATAAEGAVIVVGNELQAAFREHAKEMDAVEIKKVSEAVDAFVAAINALETARTTMVQASTTTAFLERAREARQDAWINFATDVADDLAGSRNANSGTFSQMTKALRAEAEHHRPVADEADAADAA